jgi:hypothetical protein
VDDPTHDNEECRIVAIHYSDDTDEIGEGQSFEDFAREKRAGASSGDNDGDFAFVLLGMFEAARREMEAEEKAGTLQVRDMTAFNMFKLFTDSLCVAER